MKHLRDFFAGLLGGVCIGIGGAVYISCCASDEFVGKLAGAVLFAVGLFTICVFGLGLYTGKIGYVTDNKPIYLLTLLQVWIGNFLGTAFTGWAVSTALESVKARAITVSTAKLLVHPHNALILSFFCGILMYIAVEVYRSREDAGRYIGIFVCVPVFILCSFEHCVANMFYLAAAGLLFTTKGISYTLIWTLGNTLGSVLFALGRKLLREKQAKEKSALDK